ncbi:hypothetical protein WJX82_000875 [Trebouxia sp. C0006]
MRSPGKRNGKGASCQRASVRGHLLHHVDQQRKYIRPREVFSAGVVFKLAGRAQLGLPQRCSAAEKGSGRHLVVLQQP